MVCPIIWQATVEGLSSRRKDMDEVADIFNLSFRKRAKYIIIPRVIKNFMPALLTSVGLAWESGIAAEIISVTKDSIGYYIKTNKDTFDAEYMFAWTGTVVIISLLFEFVIKYISRRMRRNA
jgi:NitT/TauT family transport system permease protein